MKRSSIGASLLVGAAALCVTSCNVAIGAGAVVVLGGIGYLSSQCYDRVQVRVLDPATGGPVCDAEVSVSDAEGAERRLRPCYNAALTEGTWRIVARRPGYAPVSTELTIAERQGSCPHYTHSVQLTLRREGEPATNPVSRGRSGEPPSGAPRSPTSDLESPPARVVPPPLPAAATTPVEPPPAAPAALPPSTAPTAPPPSTPPPAPR